MEDRSILSFRAPKEKRWEPDSASARCFSFLRLPLTNSYKLGVLKREIYSSPVLEAASPKSGFWQGHTLKAQGKDPSLSFLASSGCRHSLGFLSL